jgi:hypothetical protein
LYNEVSCSFSLFLRRGADAPKAASAFFPGEARMSPSYSEDLLKEHLMGPRGEAAVVAAAASPAAKGAGSGGGFTAAVNININDLDKVVHALSDEAMRWYKQLSGKPHVYVKEIRGNYPSIRPGMQLSVVIDDIDDMAEGYFNGIYLNIGDAKRPIHHTVTVKPGPNDLIFVIGNTGGYRYSGHLLVRDAQGKLPAFFNDTFTYDEGNVQAWHIFHLRFPGQP